MTAEPSSLHLGKESHRIDILDSIRGVAAFAVFVHHYSQLFIDLKAAGALGSLLNHLGAWGVGVFFVLSGFCIHWSTLTAKGGVEAFDARAYLIRRFFRIYPMLLISLLVCWALGAYWQTNNISGASSSMFWRHAVLISTYDSVSRVSINTVVWSVVVECHFYLLYLPLIPLIRSKGAWMALPLSLGIGIFAYAISVIVFPSGESRVMWQHTPMALWWQWCLGVCLAEYTLKNRTADSGWPGLRLLVAAAMGMLSLGIALLPGTLCAHAQRFLLPWFVVVGLSALLTSGIRGWDVPFLGWLGQISYSIYLFHPVAILVACLGFGKQPGPLGFLATSVLVVGLAAALYYALEKNFVRWGKMLLGPNGSLTVAKLQG